MAQKTPRRHPFVPLWLVRRSDIIIPLAMLSVVLAAVAVGIVLWRTDNLDLGTAGFAGVWIISFIGAASIIVPVPGLAAVCVAAAPGIGLNPLAVGIVAGSAEALGEMSGYIAGASGRGLMRRNRWYRRLRVLMGRWGGVLLFIGSAIPNPVFDFIGIVAGAVGYPIRKFLPIVFVGKAIKSSAIAYGCFYGVGVAEWIVNAT
ncbi:MAG: VTT domain-containing protein [Chloroflexi bacterium]|nr:VTT domain-containing protein [Chloroflexota bacterium]